MLGGYQTISLMDDNIYQKIINSNSKAILVGDIVIDGVRKNSVYVPVTIAGGVVTFNAYGKQYTIGSDNSITAVDHAQAEIYYFASLDDVPDDLPVGSFVAVPNDGITKVIDATKYVFDDNTTLNDVFLQLFSQGGGYITQTGNITLFDDIKTDKMVAIVFDANPILSGSTIETGINSVNKVSGVIGNFNLVICVPQVDKIITVKVNIANITEGDVMESGIAMVITSDNIPLT